MIDFRHRLVAVQHVFHKYVMALIWRLQRNYSLAAEEGCSSANTVKVDELKNVASDVKYNLPVLTAKLTQGFADGKGIPSVRGLVGTISPEIIW